MNRIKQIILLIGFILVYTQGFSQVKTVRGVVRDEHEMLVGVNVVVMNAENRVYTGVSTDVQGGYLLKIPAGIDNLYLSFSFIGYKTKKVPYKGQTELNIKLESDAKLMDEVVVRAKSDRNSMGISYKNLTSSVQRLKMEGTDEMPVTSIGDALQGKMANVDIVSMSGSPGSGMSIRIRGVSSLSTSSEPLIVLDGVPKETSFGDDFDFATATDEDLSGLVNLSPSDIESIEVLKDAAATAIWGTRGANGVLVITTKKGTVGRMTFTINQKFSYNFEPKSIEQLNGNQYISLMHDELWNRGLETKVYDVAGALQNSQINFDRNYVYWREFNQNTDWLKEITQNALQSETTASMSGGGERTIYNFSVSYLTERGTTIGTAFKRLTSRLNLTYRFSDRFNITAGVAFSQGNREENFSSPRSVAMNRMPNLSPYVMEEDGVTRTSSYFTPEETLQGKYGGTYNAVAMAKESKNESMSRNIDLNLNLIYEFNAALRYYGTIGFDVNTSSRDKFLPQEVTGVRKTDQNYNYGETSANDDTQLYVKNQLTFSKEFNEYHALTSTVVMDFTDKRNSSRSTAVSGMTSPDLSAPILGSGIITGFSSGAGQNRDYGAAVNFQYEFFKKRYLFNASYRYGANSRMNSSNRWIGLPSVSFAWRVVNEDFMSALPWISDLKFRASWGSTGNAPGGSFPSAGRFSTDTNYGTHGAVGPSTMELTNLKWEKVDKTNVGFNLNFFDEKIRFTFEYYWHTTKDLLQRNVAVPSHTGYSNIAYYNSGKMQNKGFEFYGETSNLLKSKDWVVTLNFNISGNKNVMKKLPDNVNYMQYSDNIENGRFAQSVQEGNPLGSYYGFRCLGVYKDTDATYVRDANGNYQYDVAGERIRMRHEEREVSGGDAIYEDINHDGVINKYDIVYIGSCMPKFTGGFGFSVGYKGLRLTTFFHTRIKYNIINRARMNSESMYNYNNQSVTVLNRWRYDGDETNIPKALHARGYNWLGSDRFVEDGTFIRMKELRLNYTLPGKIIQRWGIYKMSFFATGYDLFTWTKYSGQDPEVNINGGLDQYGNFQLMGVDDARTPKPRRISMGLTIQF